MLVQAFVAEPAVEALDEGVLDRLAGREVVGMDMGPSEPETFWTALLRKLARRGLRGVNLVISDAHEGIKAAIAGF